MNTCWETLGIEPTTDLERIRQVYLALLPSFHPESDPQGFKQLRQAYEEAQRWARSPVSEEAQHTTNEVVAEHAILTTFRALLASESDRFQPSAWQRFIQKLNELSLDEVNEVRWSLCIIAMATRYISLSCLSLLAKRLDWQPLEESDDIDVEHLEAFLEAINRGDSFNFLALSALPVTVQEQTILYFFELERAEEDPERLKQAVRMHGAWLTPDDKLIQRKLVRWYSLLREGMAELVDIADRWRKAEPDCEDAHYYFCAQRLYCGEGESLLPDLSSFWQQYPSTQADDMLLGWCRQHRPDFFPLLVIVIEARCMAGMPDESFTYVPGENARTRLLWAEILHSGRLSPLGRSFVESLLYKRKSMAWANSRLQAKGEPETPLLDLYRTAEQYVLEAFPQAKPFYRLLIRLERGDASLLESMITQMLAAKIPLKPGELRDKKELEEELQQSEKAPPKAEEKPSESPLLKAKSVFSEIKKIADDAPPAGNAKKALKIIGFIVLAICALNRLFHFF